METALFCGLQPDVAAGHRLGGTPRTPVLPTLNPQVSGSNPEGRTRKFHRSPPPGSPKQVARVPVKQAGVTRTWFWGRRALALVPARQPVCIWATERVIRTQDAPNGVRHLRSSRRCSKPKIASTSRDTRGPANPRQTFRRASDRQSSNLAVTSPSPSYVARIKVPTPTAIILVDELVTMMSPPFTPR